MKYDFLNLSVEELVVIYKKNKKSIAYYQNKIKQREKIDLILIGINFFFSWTLVIVGLYSILGNNFILIILGSAFIFLHFYCYMNIKPDSQELLYINSLENENNFIITILEDKFNFYEYNE